MMRYHILGFSLSLLSLSAVSAKTSEVPLKNYESCVTAQNSKINLGLPYDNFIYGYEELRRLNLLNTKTDEASKKLASEIFHTNYNDIPIDFVGNKSMKASLFEIKIAGPARYLVARKKGLEVTLYEFSQKGVRSFKQKSGPAHFIVPLESADIPLYLPVIYSTEPKEISKSPIFLKREDLTTRGVTASVSEQDLRAQLPKEFQDSRLVTFPNEYSTHGVDHVLNDLILDQFSTLEKKHALYIQKLERLQEESLRENPKPNLDLAKARNAIAEYFLNIIRSCEGLIENAHNKKPTLLFKTRLESEIRSQPANFPDQPKPHGGI